MIKYQSDYAASPGNKKRLEEMFKRHQAILEIFKKSKKQPGITELQRQLNEQGFTVSKPTLYKDIERINEADLTSKEVNLFDNWIIQMLRRNIEKIQGIVDDSEDENTKMKAATTVSSLTRDLQTVIHSMYVKDKGGVKKKEDIKVTFE